MNNAMKELALPPLNLVFSLKSFVCVVVYRNIGQMRFSAKPIAMCAEEKNSKERFFLLLGDKQKKMSADEFDAYLKEQYPQHPPEIQVVDESDDLPPGAQSVGEKKNQNVTLDVHSGPIQQKTGFKRQ